MIRPLTEAIIEYFLALLVFKYGKVHKNIFAAVLFLLATYQLGEVLIFLSNGEIFAFRIAYIATTLLPPLGVLLIEKISKKNLGYPLFQLLGLGFAVYMLFVPQIAVKFELGQFCVRIFEYDPVISSYWGIYYQGTLFYSMALMMWKILQTNSAKMQSMLIGILFGYLFFDGLTFIITYFVPWLRFSVASLMCALALIAAFVFTKISLADNWQHLLHKHLRDRLFRYRGG